MDRCRNWVLDFSITKAVVDLQVDKAFEKLEQPAKEWLKNEQRETDKALRNMRDTTVLFQLQGKSQLLETLIKKCCAGKK